MTPIYSMTGFASVQGSAGAGMAFSLTAKSVNHRFLDLQFRMPGGSDALEMKLRQLMKERLRRGHVDITLTSRSVWRRRASGQRGPPCAALANFRQAASTHGLRSEPDLNVLLRMPGVMTVQHASPVRDISAVEGAVLECVPELLDLLQRMRADEGASLAAELRSSIDRLRAMSAEIGRLRFEVPDAHYARLRGRLTKLLEGVEIDQNRLLTEAALLAERSDIEEENVRLGTHLERFAAILDEGGEVGKRLDFLLQELNREANTMLSKTGAAAGEQGCRITEIGLAMKSELERAREQVQNLE